MARWGGFEPPTLWFVARYSIQLSYQRLVMWRIFLVLNMKSRKTYILELFAIIPLFKKTMPSFKKIILSAILLCSFYVDAIASSSFIKIGVLNHQGLESNEVIRIWNPTADYLAMKLPQYDFEIIPLGFYEIEAAVNKGDVDFILTNPSIFVNLASRNRVTPLATRNNAVDEDIYNTVGGVIFTRHDQSNINSIKDLKGKTLAAVNESSLGGFQMAWLELSKHGFNPHKDTKKLIFEDSHYQVVLSVISGKADAGTVRTDTLEHLYNSKIISPNKIKIINPKSTLNFPFAHSTPLYPEWPFSKVHHVDDELAEQVTLALLRMPLHFPERIPGGYSNWSLPRGYEKVHNLLKALKLPPYTFISEFTWKDAIKRYRYWVLSGLLMLLALIAISSSLIRHNIHLRSLKQRLERQNKLILKSVSDGIYGVDTKGNCTFVNNAMQEMTGWKAKDVLDKNLYSLLHHTRKDGTKAGMEECPMYASFKDQKPHFTSDDIFWKKDNTSIAVEYSSTLMKNGEGNTIGGVVVFRDITERKKAQEKTKQHQQQLAHVARLSTLGEIASGIAHELNQPLTAIATNSRACVRMLESGKPNLESCADVMDKVAGQSERAGAVIKNIRHFVHNEPPEKKAISIQSILDTAIDLLQSEIHRHDIKLRMNIEDPEASVLVPQIQIEQVILNLTRNAIESLEEKPASKRVLTIQTQNKNNDKLEIRISDTGSGLSKKIQEQLFDPFITTKSQGMGLGLSISQGIIEAHGDRIHVDSSDQGASFYFSLQLSESLENAK